MSENPNTIPKSEVMVAIQNAEYFIGKTTADLDELKKTLNSLKEKLK